MIARRVSIALLSLSAMACDPQKSDWGLDRIRTMVTPADDPTLGCGVQIPTDPGAAARTACVYALCSSSVPCEKFTRATSIPAATSCGMHSRLAGPIVQTCLV